MDLAASLNTLHLASRIHGLLAAAMPRLNRRLVRALKQNGSLFRRPKPPQLESLANELPVLILILVLQEIEKTELTSGSEESEFLKSCLVQFFASHYVALYLEHKDPIKELLARVDWYLDGAEGPAEAMFSRFVSGVLTQRMDEPSEIPARFVTEKVLPEVRHALDLAPRYRF